MSENVESCGVIQNSNGFQYKKVIHWNYSEDIWTLASFQKSAVLRKTSELNHIALMEFVEPLFTPFMDPQYIK